MTTDRPEYLAPIQDMTFLLNEMGNNKDNEDLLFVLEQAARFAEQKLVPINRECDVQGCTFEHGQVRLPEALRKAFREYADAGWMGLSMPEEFGGQALSERLSTCVGEILTSANHTFSMTPALTMSACRAIISHGSDHLKQTYLPKLIAGQWTGTMCLTESHCGSDLGLIRSRAVEDETQSLNAAQTAYRIKGNKIFISSGNHNGSENIIHLVLARLNDAPQGIKGLSLFLVPTLMENSQGQWVQSNGVECVGIEEKMGMHGNPTCTMSFENSIGYLVGEPNKGINAMFIMMNEMRLGASLQGVGLSERSFQKSIAYATQRTQMRALDGKVHPSNATQDKGADPIIVHPDVRRMLLTQKVLAEGGRALAQFCSELLQQTHQQDFGQNDSDKQVVQLLDMLTPIAKGFCTETGLESASYAIQIHGGHGYIQETGAEQLYRDGRIATIYEGTTGIQALDLLGRKVLGTQGKSLMGFTKLMHKLREQAGEAAQQSNIDSLLNQLDQYKKEWPDITMKIGMKAMKNPTEAGAASFDYLMYSGYVTLAYFWAKMAVVSQQILSGERSANTENLSEEFLKAKVLNAQFYFERVLPRAQAHKAAMLSGMDNLMQISEAQLLLAG